MSRDKPKEEPEGIPSWLISFSDMVTLLLSFFVMLQSLATTQQPQLFYQGQGAFKRAIASFGIPYFQTGRRQSPERDYLSAKHPMQEDRNDYTRKRVLDAEDQKIRSVFKQISDRVETRVGNEPRRTISVRPTSICFHGASTTLSASDLRGLRQTVQLWRQSLSKDHITIYVIGLAADQSRPAAQWTVSAMRAAVVAKQLKRLVAPELQKGRWQVLSMGDGASSHWCGQFDLTAAHVSVVLAVMQAE